MIVLISSAGAGLLGLLGELLPTVHAVESASEMTRSTYFIEGAEGLVGVSTY